MRAAERGEQSVGTEQFQRAQVDLLVAAQSVFELALGFRERRRIEDDEIVASALAAGCSLRLPEEIERVLADDIDTEFVPRGVAEDQRGRVFADLDGLHRRSADLRARQR